MPLTKDGRLITFERREVSTRPADLNMNRGWVVHQVVATVNGEEAGYLAISYVPTQKLAEHYPTLIHFAALEGIGSCSAFVKDGDRDRLFLGIFRRPTEAPPAERDRLIQQWSLKYQDRFDDFQSFHVDRPLVDFIRTNDGFRRQHVALALYEEAGRWMAEKGMALHASGIQCPDDQGGELTPTAEAWRKMEALGYPVHRESIPYCGIPWERTLLDFREKAPKGSKRSSPR